MNNQNTTHKQTLFVGENKTNPFAKAIAAAIVIVLTLFLVSDITKAQSVGGRIAFGIDAGGNKYYGNYTDNQFAFHGDAFIRWNIFDFLSLHAAYNAGQLKYKATAGSIANETSLFPNSSASPGVLGTINHTR